MAVNEVMEHLLSIIVNFILVLHDGSAVLLHKLVPPSC